MGNCYWNYALVLALAGWAVSAMPVRAQVLCDDDRFSRASDAYEREQLMEAIRLLQPCLDKLGRLDEARKEAVLKLLAYAYFYRDEPDSSSQMVRLLVRKVDRGYRARKGDPPFFRDLVRQNRIRWYEKRWVGSVAAIVPGVVIGKVLFQREKLTEKPPWPPHN